MVPDIDAKDDYGITALHTAAAMKDYSIAEILLGRGAKVNVSDNYRQTPLVSAVRTTRPDSTVNEYIITIVVQLLLDYGANPVVMGFAGRTAQDLAELSRLELTVDLLRLRTPDINRCRQCGKKTNTRRCTGCRLVGSVSFTLPPCILQANTFTRVQILLKGLPDRELANSQKRLQARTEGTRKL